MAGVDDCPTMHSGNGEKDDRCLRSKANR